MVVVDDGSTDDTLKRLNECSDARVRVVAHEQNMGINPSRHTGVAHARGEWLMTLATAVLGLVRPRALAKGRLAYRRPAVLGRS